MLHRVSEVAYVRGPTVSLRKRTPSSLPQTRVFLTIWSMANDCRKRALVAKKIIELPMEGPLVGNVIFHPSRAIRNRVGRTVAVANGSSEGVQN